MCQDGSCSLRCKVYFLAIWSIAHGIFYFLGSVVKYCSSDPNLWFIGPTLFLVLIICNLVGMIGGVLMILGVKKNKKTVLIIGLVLVWVPTIFIIFLIYPLVLYIVFTIYTAQYIRQM
ncbi:uncharacterized protein LOC111603289 [Drosophila hydei]|uniref:Uncharacterized protein LOC111603289 n=1 Tax=Drosophila hydei TaxID=7224 RepID=A0A6J1MHM9_DROHY|nr:uncharacterized protein LOC111603289 [Drosophila hydei]